MSTGDYGVIEASAYAEIGDGLTGLDGNRFGADALTAMSSRHEPMGRKPTWSNAWISSHCRCFPRISTSRMYACTLNSAQPKPCAEWGPSSASLSSASCSRAFCHNVSCARRQHATATPAYHSLFHDRIPQLERQKLMSSVRLASAGGGIGLPLPHRLACMPRTICFCMIGSTETPGSFR